MTRISAANNLTIDMQSARWRLIANGALEQAVLVEATAGGGVHVAPQFARRRRLPNNGALAARYIQQVVLGWSTQDQSWHLGLLFEESLAQLRGGRWCELAVWHGPDVSRYADVAAEAGKALAHTIERPFRLVPPKTPNGVAVQAAVADTPRAPLRTVTTVDTPPSSMRAAMADAAVHPGVIPVAPAQTPLKLGLWRMIAAAESRVELARSRRWTREKLLRSGWYALWVVVYILLAVTTLESGIALPKPEFLPFLGLGIALVLFFLILNNVYRLLTEPNKVVVDGREGLLQIMRGQRELWRAEAGHVEAVYVTQVVKKNGVIQHGEINLHLYDGDFRLVLNQGQPDGRPRDATPINGGAADVLLPLGAEAAHTDLQAAGLHIANTLAVPCWYDRRVK